MLITLFLLAALVLGNALIRRPRKRWQQAVTALAGALMLAVVVAWGIEYVVSTAKAAAAEPVWREPGWYVVADTIVGPFVWTGPYASQPACEARKPPNEEDADYACEFLNERPSWDD